MLAAIRKLLKLKPWYMALYLMILLLLVISSIIEYQSRYQELLRLIQGQASMTAAVIAQSGSGQAYLTEEIKQTYINHAIDVLSIINKLDAEKDMSSSRLNQLMDKGHFLKVIIFDEKGRVEHAVSKEDAPEKSDQNVGPKWVERYLQPLLNREDSLVVVGVDPEPGLDLESAKKNRFLVAIVRDRGGVLAGYLSVEAEKEFKYLTALETALDDLLQVKDLQYLKLAMDESAPYYVSKDGLVIDDTWNRKPLGDILYQVSKGGVNLLEIVRPVFFNSGFGEVRIGFKSDILVKMQDQMLYQILVRTLLLTLLGFVIVIFLIARQNASLLKVEKERIEAEVYRLERLNRLREKQAAMGELAAGVAHEIRNPLNAIGIVAQRLKREFQPTEEQDDYIALTGTMVSEIGKINQSLQDFLEYTKPTPLNISLVSVGELLHKTRNLYLSQAAEKRVKILIESPEFDFEVDENYLEQAVGNVIRNAIEASDEEGVVSIIAARKKNYIRITFQDTGSGIRAEDLNRIFDLYYSTKDLGTGVGLALTHKIIADHSGTIDVESELGTGSTFEINIPVEQ